MVKINKNNYDKNLKKQNIVLITLIILIGLYTLAILFLGLGNPESPAGIYLFILLLFLVITFIKTFFKRKTNKFLRIGLYLILLLIFLGMLYYILIWILSLSGFDINSFRSIDRSSFKFILFVIIVGFIGILSSVLFPASLILILIGLFSKSDNSESKSKKQQPIQNKSQTK